MPARAHDLAKDVAKDAAGRSGVQVRTLNGLADLYGMVDVINEIWRPEPSRPLMTIEQAQAMNHTGNYLAGAFESSADPGAPGDRMVGACIGFFAAPPGAVLHSHIAGVLPRAHGRSIGFAVKLHQRAWALEHGLTEITWTFDPLVRRNAYFNLVKLGAVPRQYLVDFYGDIHDAINTGQGSDRLFVRWDLRSPDTAARCLGDRSVADADELRGSGAVEALIEDDDGGPLAASQGVLDRADVLLVQIPRDIENLRGDDSALAKRWRMAVRDLLGGLLTDGARVTGFTREGHYVVERC